MVMYGDVWHVFMLCNGQDVNNCVTWMVDVKKSLLFCMSCLNDVIDSNLIYQGNRYMP